MRYIDNNLILSLEERTAIINEMLEPNENGKTKYSVENIIAKIEIERYFCFDGKKVEITIDNKLMFLLTAKNNLEVLFGSIQEEDSQKIKKLIKNLKQIKEYFFENNDLNKKDQNMDVVVETTDSVFSTRMLKEIMDKEIPIIENAIKSEKQIKDDDLPLLRALTLPGKEAILKSAIEEGQFTEVNGNPVACSPKGELIDYKYLEYKIDKERKAILEEIDIIIKGQKTYEFADLIKLLKGFYDVNYGDTISKEEYEILKKACQKLKELNSCPEQINENYEIYQLMVEDLNDRIENELAFLKNEQGNQHWYYKDKETIDSNIEQFKKQQRKFLEFLSENGVLPRSILMYYLLCNDNIFSDKDINALKIILDKTVPDNNKFYIEEIEEIYKQRRDGSSKGFFLKALPLDFWIKEVLDGEERPEVLGKKRISSEDILQLDEELLMQVLESQKIPEQYKPKQEQIINSNLTGKTLIELAQKGIIGKEQIIQLYMQRKSEQVLEDEKRLDFEQVLNLYDMQTLQKLIDEEKVTEIFKENFKKLTNVEGKNDDEKSIIEAYFQNLLKNANGKENEENTNKNAEENLPQLLKMYLKGLIPAQIMSQANIGENTIEDQYLENKITEDNLLQLFNDALISRKELRKILKKEEIKDHYKNGNLNYHALPILDNNEILDTINQAITDEQYKERFGNVIRSFFDTNGLEIDRLNEILSTIDLRGKNVTEYIEDSADFEKVKQLFLNRIISESELSILSERKIIDEEQIKEIKNSINEQEMYSKLFYSDKKLGPQEIEKEKATGKKYGKRTTDTKPNDNTKNFEGILELLLEQLGGKDEIILTGNKNSLNGYTMHGIPKLGMVVLEKASEAGNATYIMTLNEANYIFEQESKFGNDNIPQPKEVNVTKQKLIESDCCFKCNKSKNFVKNMIDKMIELLKQDVEKNEKKIAKLQKLQNNNPEISSIKDMMQSLCGKEH